MADRIIRPGASFYVYLHRRATDGRVFYIGKGTGNRSARTDSRNSYWRNVVAKHGFQIEYVVCGVQEWYAIEVERDQIALYGRENLCNLTDGGEGGAGLFVSAETRAKKSAIQTGRKHTPEMRKKISESVKLAMASLPARQSRPITDETRAKLSRAGRRPSPRVGQPLSAETKRKMSEAAKGRVISPEQRAKLSAALKRANGTPEKRKEISDRMKALRAKQRSERMAAQQHQ